MTEAGIEPSVSASEAMTTPWQTENNLRKAELIHRRAPRKRVRGVRDAQMGRVF